VTLFLADLFDSYAYFNDDCVLCIVRGLRNSGTLAGSSFESEHPYVLIYARNQIRHFAEKLKALPFPRNGEGRCSDFGQAKNYWFEDGRCRSLVLAVASVSGLET
jgi:hypothetical protein